MAVKLVNAGRDWLIDKLDELVQTTGDYIGWGSGAGVTAVADTTLFTEESEARVVAVRTQPASDTIQWVSTLAAAAGKTITNAGNFTAAAAGTLIVKGDHAGVVLLAGDQITYTISLQILN